jgi:hypothetical protein
VSHYSVPQEWQETQVMLMFSISGRPQITAAMQKKLMAYDMALRLHVENFACDYQAIADDLATQPAK